jgi:hypothetical protein
MKRKKPRQKIRLRNRTKKSEEQRFGKVLPCIFSEPAICKQTENADAKSKRSWDYTIDPNYTPHWTSRTSKQVDVTFSEPKPPVTKRTQERSRLHGTKTYRSKTQDRWVIHGRITPDRSIYMQDLRRFKRAFENELKIAENEALINMDAASVSRCENLSKEIRAQDEKIHRCQYLPLEITNLQKRIEEHNAQEDNYWSNQSSKMTEQFSAAIRAKNYKVAKACKQQLIKPRIESNRACVLTDKLDSLKQLQSRALAASSKEEVRNLFLEHMF